MGLMPQANPFTKYDRQTVIGIFKASGSSDRDVLYSQKEQMLTQSKQFRLLGMICMIGGAFFTVTFILAIAGVPIAIFGWWIRRFGTQNAAVIEQGYSEFVATVGAA